MLIIFKNADEAINYAEKAASISPNDFKYQSRLASAYHLKMNQIGNSAGPHSEALKFREKRLMRTGSAHLCRSKRKKD